jgi:hypothetical protein
MKPRTEEFLHGALSGLLAGVLCWFVLFMFFILGK